MNNFPFRNAAHEMQTEKGYDSDSADSIFWVSTVAPTLADDNRA